MRQEVGPRHPVYTRASEAAPVRAQKLSRVDEQRVRGLAGVGVLAVALARTANGLNVIGRRDAATTQRSRLRTRKRDREVPRHEDEILSKISRANITVFEFAKTTDTFSRRGHVLEGNQNTDPPRGRSGRRSKIGGKLIFRRQDRFSREYDSYYRELSN